MKNTLVVVADLGGFKAFRLDNSPLHSNPRLELVEEFKNPGAHTRLVDQVTDLSGRFPRTTGTASSTHAMSMGERHNIGLEWRKRLVRQLARRMERLVRNPEVDGCFLAASREINRPLVGELNAQSRAKIELNISADLTKIEKSELLRHFKPQPRPSQPEIRTSARV